MLLAAACVTDPTVDLLAEATGTTTARTVKLLEPVEDNGIIESAQPGGSATRCWREVSLRRQSRTAAQNASGASRH